MNVYAMKHERRGVFWEEGDQIGDVPSPLLGDVDRIDRVFTS